MPKTFGADGVVQSGVYNAEEYRRLMNGWIDHIEEEYGDDAVFVFGGFIGKASFNGPTSTYPNSHRVNGNLGFASCLLDGEEYDGEMGSPIGAVFEDSALNAPIGSAAYPKELLSEEAREAVERSGGVTAPINPEAEDQEEEPEAPEA